MRKFIISSFKDKMINGKRWINSLRKFFEYTKFIDKVSVILWATFINIKIENDAVIKLIKKIDKINEKSHIIKEWNMKISLNKLIDGGAEILIAIKINHQNIKLGKDVIIPLNDKIFRVWYLE